MKRRGKSQATLDGFVVRSPRVSPASSPTKKEGVMRQATLESLKGVVVVEEMERARVVLERTDVCSDLKVDTLQHLLRKNPAKEVLIKTKLGKTVHKLCRAEDPEVSAAAQQVYTSWKEHILSKLNRPYIEVKCDLKTQKLRKSAREMLLEALQRETEEGGEEGEPESSKGQVDVSERKETKQSVHKQKEKHGEKNNTGKPTHKRPRDDSDIEKHEHKTKSNQEEEYEDRGDYNRINVISHTEKSEQNKTKVQDDEKEREDRRGHKRARDTQETHDSVDSLAEHMEREVYHCHSRRVDNSYRRTIRSMVFTLRHKKDVRKAVVSATLSVEDFIKEYRKS